MTKSSEFRRVFERSLADIASRTPESERCLILSGGVDTCAILAAADAIGVSFPAAFTVVCTGENEGPDLAFAVAAAEAYGMSDRHHVLRVGAEELVSTHLPACVKRLRTFDGMTLRNSLVVAAAFRKASEMGYKHAIVGDGADELFGGYSFMWGCEDDPAKWREKRDKMCREWTFATEDLAKMHGLTSHGPYMEPEVVRWALESAGREDCIGAPQIRLVHGGEAVEHVAGKILLREAYDTVASWRRKDPIEVGSGITVIGHDPYWADIVPDSEFRKEKTQFLSRGFVIKSKEHLVNFRAFEASFGAFGENFPGKKRLSIEEGCSGCCFDIGEETFCKICGAYPAQRK